MLLYNAVRLGEAIEEYNKHFKEDQHLDFHEVVSLMYDLNDEEELEKTLEEINKRIRICRAALKLYKKDMLTKYQCTQILKAL